MVCAAAVGGGRVSADGNVGYWRNKETKDAKAADSETGGEADAEEEETVVVPVIGYSTRSAAGSDYGVMPLADAADPSG